MPPSDNLSADVLVVGAGAAGIAAAVAAGESGLKVILLERYGFLGGLATAAMVGTVCGLYYRGGASARYAVQGFARKFAEGLAQRSHSKPYVYDNSLYFLPYQPAAFHLQAALELEQAGVQLMLQSQVSQVKVKNGRISTIEAMLPDWRMTLQPETVIDCTGEAIISILAGQEMLMEPSCHSAALVFQVDGLPDMQPGLLALNLIRWLKKGIHEGQLHQECDRLSIVPGTFNNHHALFKLGIPVSKSWTINSRTESELLARLRASEIVTYLANSVDLLNKLSIQIMAPQLGIRTGQRPQGHEKLEKSDVLSCAKPDNGIAIGAWPMEKWANGKKPEMTYFDENDHYEIPAGALVSRQLSNLFFAGRGLSASEDAIASARVIGTCLSTGYAAGKLAAGHVQKEQWQDSIDRIRQAQILSQEK